MYQNLYKLIGHGRLPSLFAMVMVVSACQSFGPHCHGDEDCGPGQYGASGEHAHDHDHDHQHAYSKARGNSAGLIVGAVVNAEGKRPLAAYERWRYADQLASNILQVNPELTGSVDSYEYLSRRVGEPLKPLLLNYRLKGDLDVGALAALKSAQLRRRYLMLASIQPYEESISLKADSEPVVGPFNPEVHDYYDLSRQTVLLTGVRVQIYDTLAGSKIFDSVIRSDDGGRALARENRSRKYVGNSVVASISNSIANGLSGSVAGAYPAPPERDDVLAFIWDRIAQQLPGDILGAP